MRRKDRAVTHRAEQEDILRACKVCSLAMIADGKPYVVPLNFGYEWQDDALVLWFHGARGGKKYDALRQNPAACFEVNCEHRLIEGQTACQYTFAFASLIGEGSAFFAETDEQKVRGLTAVMRHQTGKADWTFSAPHMSVTNVFGLRVDKMEGKRLVAK